MCPHVHSCISVLIATTMHKNDYAQVEPCDGSWLHAIVWEVCVPRYCDKDNAPPQKIELLMCCTLNLSALKEFKKETLSLSAPRSTYLSS